MVNAVVNEKIETLAGTIVNFLKETGFWFQVSLTFGDKQISAGPNQTDIINKTENSKFEVIDMEFEGPLYRAIHDYYYDRFETYVELTRLIENAGYTIQFEHSWNILIQKSS